MAILRSLWSRFSWRRARAVEREVGEEISFHVQMRTEANVAAGMSLEQARAEASRAFGDAQTVRAQGRAILAGAPLARDGMSWFDTLRQDAVFGFRQLCANKFTSIIAVLSLALGIGANTANFSLVYGTLYRALPFADGERLMSIDALRPGVGDGDTVLTWGDLADVRASGAFEAAEALSPRNYTVAGGDRPERVAGAAVTPAMFPMLGIEPQIGRPFRPDEGAEAGFETVALISDGLWTRLFARDPQVLGATLRLNDREVQIVGVMPPEFQFPNLEDLWLPLGADDPTARQARLLNVVAKRAAGVSETQVEERLATVSAAAERTYPDTHSGVALRALPFREGVIDATGQRMILMMMASVAFVLILAIANVANLLLARATDRQPELVLRSALGASRGRLVRQVLTECLVLGLAGGVIGIVLARVWVEALLRMIPERMAYWIVIGVDSTALTFTVLVSVGSALLFGILPALQASGHNHSAALQGAGRAVGAGGRRGAIRSLLVVGEVALAVVLLVSAGLMVTSFLTLQRADAGFDVEPLLSMRITASGDTYDDLEARRRFYINAVEEIEATPGVLVAAATGAIPADDGSASVSLLPDDADSARDETIYGEFIPSTHRFFETLDVSILEGRALTRAETLDPDSQVVVVGQGLARRFWPGESAVGRTLLVGTNHTPLRIVGVVGDLQYEEFGEETPSSRLQVHAPYALANWRGMAFLVRTNGDPNALIEPIRDALLRADPTLAAHDVLSMRERRAVTQWPQRVFGTSFGFFGFIALVLAIGGVYGVVAYTVSRRGREIGVRIALGARAVDVQRQVVGSSVRLALLGCAIGSFMAYGFAQALAGALYGVDPGDLRILVGVVVAMLAAASAAGYVPARRASAVDPAESLRADA